MIKGILAIVVALIAISIFAPGAIPVLQGVLHQALLIFANLAMQLAGHTR